MKILSVECHETLSFDQINIWTELGHTVCSTGFFLDPQNPLTNVRPPTKNTKNEAFIQHFRALNPNYVVPSMHPNAGLCILPLEMLNQFDVVIIDYYPWIFTINEEALKRTTAKIILRTIGFGAEYQEQFYVHAKSYRPDMKIVRMSARERMCQIYAGENAIIPQCYNPDDFIPWQGNKQQILTINKMFKKRADGCGYDKYMEVMRPFEKERMLVGFDNEDIPFSKHIPHDELKNVISESRCYLSTMSKPASCITYAFIEAWCSGCPVVSFGNKTGNYGGDTFMIDKYIQNGVNGFYSDDTKELQQYLRDLLSDEKLAKRISMAGKESGLKLFHRDIIKQQWKEVLESL